jgi:hypothetical protein
MANNTDLLNQIRKVVPEEVTTEIEPIKMQLDEHGKKLDRIEDLAAHTQTTVEIFDEKIDAIKN